jgi:hypothetical protein
LKIEELRLVKVEKVELEKICTKTLQKKTIVGV